MRAPPRDRFAVSEISPVKHTCALLVVVLLVAASGRADAQAPLSGPTTREAGDMPPGLGMPGDESLIGGGATRAGSDKSDNRNAESIPAPIPEGENEDLQS